MGQTENEATNLTDSFNSSAQTYERRVGSATRAVAAHIVRMISRPTAHPTVLDNACGTGAMTQEILKVMPNARVHAVDGSPAMVEIVKHMVLSNDQAKNVNVQAMDGQLLRFADQTFDISITNFGVFFFPDPIKGIREIYRTLKVGGAAVVSCWKSIGVLPIFYEAQKHINPASPVSSMPVFEERMKKETLEAALTKGGFRKVHIEEKGVYITGEDEKELIMGLVDNMKGMIGERWSDDEKAELDEVTRSILKSHEDELFVDLGGHKGVRMVAWIAMANK